MRGIGGREWRLAGSWRSHVARRSRPSGAEGLGQAAAGRPRGNAGRSSSGTDEVAEVELAAAGAGDQLGRKRTSRSRKGARSATRDVRLRVVDEEDVAGLAASRVARGGRAPPPSTSAISR